MTLLQTLSGLLHLGNIQIGENQNGDAYVQGAAELKTTAQLLSTHEELLQQAP